MKNEIETIEKIKKIFEEIQLNNKDFTLDNFNKQVKSFQEKREILLRYQPFLEIDENQIQIDQKRKKDFFKIQIRFFKIEGEEDIINYCKAKGITLENYFKEPHSNKKEKKITNWKKEKFLKKVYGIFQSEMKIENYKHSNSFCLHKSQSQKFIDEIGIFKNEVNWGELSGEENFNWSIENLLKGKDLWDWTQLANNKSIKWNFTMIDIFKEYIDWNFVKVYKHLEWNGNLIEKYSNYIFNAKEIEYGSHLETYCKTINHSGYFESNENIDWTESLIDKYLDKWDWKYLSRNPKIKFSLRQLEKYKENIDWYWSFFQFGNTDWSDEVFNKYVTSKMDWQMLVKNQFIKWDDFIFDKYIKNDIELLRSFCVNAKISDDLIIKNQDIWNTKISKSGYHRRNSDGTREYTTYHSLWENLFKNKNIIWNDDLLEACLQNLVINEMSLLNSKNIVLSVNFIEKYWDFKKTENWWCSGSYDEEEKMIQSTFHLKDYIQGSTITDLTFHDFVYFEFKWYGIFFSKKKYADKVFYLMNESIRELLLNEQKTVSENIKLS